MSPIDYVAPMQTESAALSPDAATDELEWLAIESQAIIVHGFKVHAPDGKNVHGDKLWYGPKASRRMHPKAYRIPGESAGIPGRAKSVADAMAQLDVFSGHPTFIYTPPTLGPWERHSVKARDLYDFTALRCGLVYDSYRRTWR